MQNTNHYSMTLFPDPVSFQFKKIDDGQMIKLSFYAHIKMKEFIQEVIQKSYVAFNIPNTKNIEVIENGEPLDINDETLISVKYANNYKYTAFHIRIN
jgi:hypothetical protein